MGNIKYPTRSPRPISLCGDGQPLPFDMPDIAEGGVSEPISVEQPHGEFKYKPSVQSNTGDDGLG